MRQLFPWGLGGAVVCWLALAPCCSGQDADKEFQKQVNKAIDKGVTHLKSIQTPDGTWRYAHYHPGTTNLVTWTLLEAGVPRDDKQVAKALDVVRKNALAETNTYNISIAIFLFDKLGEERDIPLIESLAWRLLAGQNSQGGWTYENPSPTPEELQRIARAINGPPPPPAVLAFPRKMSPEIARQIEALKFRDPNSIPRYTLTGDNSNTQFAMIALWVSGKYGIPVQEAMLRVGARFRSAQWSDGSWKYELVREGEVAAMSPHQTPAMTCAGLLGLSLSHAADPANAKKSLLDDPQVLKGMELLYNVMKYPERQNTAYGQKFYYTLWSLERVAVVYNLAKIKDIEWYRWGAEHLLARQGTDGRWAAEYDAGGVDTCLLLFLKRVNVVGDLTSKIAKNPPKKEDGFLRLVPIVENPGGNEPPKKDPTVEPIIDPPMDPKKDPPTDPKKDPPKTKPKPLFPKTSSSVDPYGEELRALAFRDHGRIDGVPQAVVPVPLTLNIAPRIQRAGVTAHS